MSEMLLEIYGSETPARIQREVENELHNVAHVVLQELRLQSCHPEVFITPRRSVIMIRDFPEMLPGYREKIVGPQVRAGEKALVGFAKSVGCAPEDCTREDSPKGERFVVHVDKPDIPANTLAEQFFEMLLQRFRRPISLKWSEDMPDWMRPVERLLCIVDGQPVSCKFGNMIAGNLTLANCYYSSSLRQISSCSDYLKFMRDNNVILDAKERSRLLQDSVRNLAKQHSVQVNSEDLNNLADEVSGTVECCTALYASLPECCLQSLPAGIVGQF